jgi:adenine-specific DNA-methyltransferase
MAEKLKIDAKELYKKGTDLGIEALITKAFAKGERIPDIGFKVFKLETSNLKKWDNAPTKDENVIRDRIQQSLDYIVDGRTDLDLVYEVMLKYGIDITFPISEIESEGKKAYIINASDYQLFVCCAPQLSSKAIDEFANLSVGTYIFADRCFATDNDLVNTAELLKSKNK